MSENYQADVKTEETVNGTVSFATDVIATIVGLAVTEVEGVAGMSGQAAGIADMFAKKNTKNFSKGVRIDMEGNLVKVDISLVVEYGFPIPEVAAGIQENVKKAIETMCGLEVNSIDLHIIGISFEREQRAAAELDAKQKQMLSEEKNEDVSEIRESSDSKETEKEDTAEECTDETVQTEGE